MALTIVKKPAALILAKQPVAFTVDSSNAGTPLRIKANLTDSTDADSVAVNGNGEADFELSDYLQGLITERYKTAATPAIYTNHPAVVQVEFRELVGSPAVVGAEMVSDPFYVLDGYLPQSKRKALYANYTSLLAYLIDTKSFLSWWPLNTAKTVLPAQKEFLNYLQLYSPSPITIYMSVLLSFSPDGDDEVDMIGVYANVQNVDYMQMVYFPTGYAELGIAAFLAANNITTPLDHYTVYLGSGIYGISEYRKYVVDTKHYENIRYLYIRNAFGLLEVVRCTGQGEQTNEFKFEIARTDGRILPNKLNWKHEKTESVKVNTGFMTRDQMQWLSDMDFTEAYELVDGVLQSIVFKDLKLPVIHDGEYQYSAELEYEYAYTVTPEQA